MRVNGNDLILKLYVKSTHNSLELNCWLDAWGNELAYGFNRKHLNSHLLGFAAWIIVDYDLLSR